MLLWVAQPLLPTVPLTNLSLGCLWTFYIKTQWPSPDPHLQTHYLESSQEVPGAD